MRTIRLFRCLPVLLMLAGISATALAQDQPSPAASQSTAQPMAHGDMGGHDMAGHGMAHMAGHMYMTKQRAISPGDQAKADAVVARAKAAIAPYQDYRKALADGYQITLPKIPQHQYHFTNHQNAREAISHFDASKPTSLLYWKTPDGGYKLMGVMYTDQVNASESELNDRIPLSIAHWHQHINFCKAPANDRAAYFGPNAKFGLRGSIITQQACDEAGGTFRPHLFGWMVHLYPFETDPKRVWSTDNDAEGHDNMDQSPVPAAMSNTMPGMKMN